MVKVLVDELLKSPHTFDFFHRESPVAESLLALELYPPLPVADGTLVWGFQYVDLAQSLGVSELICRRIGGTPSELLLVALVLENRRAKYTIYERAAIARYVSENNIHTGLDELSLQVTGNAGFFRQIAQFLELPEWLQSLVAENKLDIKTAAKLKSLPENVCKPAAAYDGFSFSQRRLFLTYVYESSRRDGLREDQIADRVQELLREDSPLNGARMWRFPALSRLDERFRTISDRYLRDTGIALNPPENFEGDAFAVSFHFRNRGDLQRKILHLQKLENGCDELESLL